MKRLIGFLFFIAAVAAPLSTLAQELRFHDGQELTHALSVCLKKEDAVEVAKVDSEKGLEAASSLWDAKEQCATVPVSGFTVGKVVFSAPGKRQSKPVTISVVEMVGGGEVRAYFVTSAPIDKKVAGDPKTKQNS